MGFIDEKTKSAINQFTTNAANNPGKGGGSVFGNALFGAVGAPVGASSEDVQGFLFGKDPGKGARDALTQFGLTGGPLAQEYESSAASLLGEGVGKQSALNRMARSRQLARMGLSGTELGADFLDDPELDAQEALVKGLRNVKLDLFSKRLQALGLAAGQPKEPGLIQSAAGPVASYFLGPRQEERG